MATVSEQVAFGIVTALPKEYAAMKCMLDAATDLVLRGRVYSLGRVPAKDGQIHWVALALADQGTAAATYRATLLSEDFPQIEAIIMCGIAGGVPNVDKPDRHARLGDVVVSGEGGIVAYDFIKERTESIEPRHPPRPPHAGLLQACRRLEARSLEGTRPWLAFLARASQLPDAARPLATTDVLGHTAKPDEISPHPVDTQRQPNEPRIFIGTIACANRLLKNPARRDQLRDAFDVRAVEMEAFGIAEATWNQSVGYLVVRGVCDYCDANKGDFWQGYAAVVAAAYVRSMLEEIPSPHGMGRRTVKSGISQSPSPVTIPPRASRPYFYGRASELDDIERWLAESDIPVLSIDGPGGIGKSELARAIAQEQLARKGNVVWLERPDRDLGAALAAMISLRRGYQPTRASDRYDEDASGRYIELVDRIAEMRTLLGGTSGLIVLDDVAAPSAVDCLTPSSNWKVLLTTQVVGLVVGAKPLHLCPLSVSDALHILSRIAWDTDEPPTDDVVDANKLVVRFGANPLALEIVGATLRDGLSIARYLASLDAGEGAGAADQDAIHQALLRSLVDLDATSRAAFMALAVLPTTGATAQMVATTISAALPDVRSSLKRLVRYNLAVQSDDTNRYSQHATIRDAARARLRRAGSGSWDGYHSGASKAVEQLLAWVLETNGKRSDIVRARFRDVADLFDGIELKSWLDGAPGARELGTALAVVAALRTSSSLEQQEETLNRVEQLLGGEANQEAEHRWRWAYFYQARAALRAAQGQLSAAVLDLDAAFERFSDSIDKANALEERAKVFSRAGRVGDAARDFGVALGMFRVAKDSAGVANALFGLGACLSKCPEASPSVLGGLAGER
jgi:nucleoside phosphorylase